jgi:hypothetical protein
MALPPSQAKSIMGYTGHTPFLLVSRNDKHLKVAFCQKGVQKGAFMPFPPFQANLKKRQ